MIMIERARWQTTTPPVTPCQQQADRRDRRINCMVWFQVDIPLVVGLLLMAALMDLRVFKLGLLVASILLMFSATGVIVFGTKLGIIPTHAVAVLSVMVWLACVASVIGRRFRSKRPYEPFGSRADRPETCEIALTDGASMLSPTTKRLTSQISSEFQFIKPISGQFGSTLYGVVLGEAGWVGAVELVRLHREDGWVPLPRTFGPTVLQIAIGPVTNIPWAP